MPFSAGPAADAGGSDKKYNLSYMDIKRPGKSKLKKRVRTIVLVVVGVGALAGMTYGLRKLKPAAPTLDRSTAVIDKVKRGPMVRDVRGIGTLVPQ